MRLGVEETVCGGRAACGSMSKGRVEEAVFIPVTPRVRGGEREMAMETDTASCPPLYLPNRR